MDIKSLMKTKQELLTSALNTPISHPVTKGDHCEKAWIEFFRKFLPSKYAVDKGLVFDSTGKISEQIDIIIYDALYAPLIFVTDAGEKMVTAESVYAVFESKPKIEKDTLKYANKKIASVTSLHRSTRTVFVGGRQQAARELTHIIGGILAIDSFSTDKIAEHCKVYDNIDVGCAINKCSFQIQRGEGKSFQAIKSYGENEVISSFFFLILDRLYELGTVAGLDIREYANAILGEKNF